METIQKYYKITTAEEYNKNPKLSEADVQELVEWSNENLNSHGKIIDLQIIMFLNACDYDKEYTKKVIQMCYTLKAKKCSFAFSERDPANSSIQQLLDILNFNIIPDEDTGFCYIWANIKNFDSSKYHPDVASKIMFMAIDLDQIEHGTRSGYKLMLDGNHFGLGHVLRFSLVNAKHLMTYVQEATSFKIDKIYLLNVTLGLDKLYSMIRPFMHSSLIHKVVIMSTSKTTEFLKTLPPKIVPEDYNGLAPCLIDGNETLKKKLLENRNYFIDEEKCRNGTVKDEIEKTTNENENIDVHSFKQLSFD